MNNNDMYSFGFHPRDDRQIMIFEDFKKLRAVFGTPHKIAYLRSLVKTRPNVRSVYPPGWKFR